MRTNGNDNGITEIIEVLRGPGLRMVNTGATWHRQRVTRSERAPEALRTIAARHYEFRKTLRYPQKPASQPFVPLSPASLGNLAAGSFFGQDQTALHILVCVPVCLASSLSRRFLETFWYNLNCQIVDLFFGSVISSRNSVLGLLKFVYFVFFSFFLLYFILFIL